MEPPFSSVYQRKTIDKREQEDYSKMLDSQRLAG
jgi:hypothetical protein